MQMGFYYDQTRCIGCYTCSIACKDWHDIGAGPVNWRRVKSTERGKFPKPVITFLSLSCNHCAEPVCVLACPVNAITKREEDGIVIVNRKRCLGRDNCGALCKKACPYNAPQFEDEGNAKMQKCDLCLDRWIEGKKPICVEACPMRALDAGPLDELKVKYGSIREAYGFAYSAKARPSIIFKPKMYK
jgi:anaerobic dimethyl sulfoxide reductase subunit B (iron-sulfur subunit)